MREFDEIDVKVSEMMTKEKLVSIGKRLKELRQLNNLTQVDVSFYCYCNLTTIFKLERGKLQNITLNTLIKLAMLYKLDISELLL